MPSFSHLSYTTNILRSISTLLVSTTSRLVKTWLITAGHTKSGLTPLNGWVEQYPWSKKLCSIIWIHGFQKESLHLLCEVQFPLYREHHYCNMILGRKMFCCKYRMFCETMTNVIKAYAWCIRFTWQSYSRIRFQNRSHESSVHIKMNSLVVGEEASNLRCRIASQLENVHANLSTGISRNISNVKIFSVLHDTIILEKMEPFSM